MSKGSTRYRECLYIWHSLPDNFRSRWKAEAGKMSMTGYALFMKTNTGALKNGEEFRIAPWF